MGFTKEQLKAINEENNNIIVSAGAGSGKTAVLTERVIRKLKDGVDIDKILILTFTNEAAAEMRSRIRSAIKENKLTKQLSLLDSAYITTFDSYALSLVKKYHYILNISKEVSIVDRNIIDIFKRKELDIIFEELYKENNPQFIKLINDFCLKDDDNIKYFILKLSKEFDLLLDKESYINNYINNYYNEDNINNYISSYINLIKDKIKDINNTYEELLPYLKDSLIDKLNDYLSPLFNGKSYEDYLLFKTKTIRYVGVEETGKDIKELLVAKTKEIINLLSYESLDEIKETILKTKDYAVILLDIIKELNKKVNTYKEEHDTYEFNDIAHFAINLVKDNQEIQEELKNYFNEIMIDEYQDTSIIQETFINLISNNNVYMVGDIKQSIYRFRNANPYIFKNKYESYRNNKDGIKIDLLKNFRSRKETLENINALFNIIMDNELGDANYLEEHNMIPGNEDYIKLNNNQNNYLEIYNYESNDLYKDYEKELFIVAEDIIKKINEKYLIYDKKDKILRPVKYSDFCIITDRNKYLDTYKKILEYKCIPSSIYKDEVLNQDDDILVLKNLISLIIKVNNNEYDTEFKYLYTSITRSFLFEIKDDDIYQRINNNNYKDDEIILLARKIDLYKPINEIINQIINEFKVYEKLTILNNIETSIIRINNLVSIASTLNKLGYTIKDFIDYFNEIIDNKLEIKYSVKDNIDNAVKIMNIHKSKGLEFPICYYVGMKNEFTISELKEKILFNEKYGLILPYEDTELKDTIIKYLYKEDYLREEISEKIRLLYVALTRCREKMIIVASLDKEKIKYQKLIDKSIRLKYRSFNDILNSVSVYDNLIIDKEAEYTHAYMFTKDNNATIKDESIIVEKRENIIEYLKLLENKYSKKIEHINTLEEIQAMEYGTMIHEELEFSNNTDYWLKLLNQIDKDYLNIYKEYEFIYEKDNEEYHGIIDLLIEYKNKFIIIDYKLKNIEDENYLKQLNGYKEYIESISNKKVEIYLYSILDNILNKL